MNKIKPKGPRGEFNEMCLFCDIRNLKFNILVVRKYMTWNMRLSIFQCLHSEGDLHATALD